MGTMRSSVTHPPPGLNDKDEKSKRMPRIRPDEHKLKRQLTFKLLIIKLLILVTVNVTVSTLCLFVLYPLSTFLAASSDLIISTVCLWLMFSFNQRYYKKFCNPCIKISKKCCFSDIDPMINENMSPKSSQSPENISPKTVKKQPQEIVIVES